jgi:hypothetical protein
LIMNTLGLVTTAGQAVGFTILILVVVGIVHLAWLVEWKKVDRGEISYRLDTPDDDEHTAPGRPQNLRALPYGEYLQTPHWKRKREDKLRAVGRRCQVCNHGPDTLEVHHRTYERLGQELDEDLTVLCRACHGTFHDHRGLSR